jgi:hypothetical protein
MNETTAPPTRITREGLLKSLHLGRILKVPPDMPAVLEIAHKMQAAGEIQPYAPRGQNAFSLTQKGLAEAIQLYGPVVAEIPMATELDLAIPDVSKSKKGAKDDQLAEFARQLRLRFNYTSAADELSDPNSVIHGADTKEPVFVLRGADVLAAKTVEYWAYLAQLNGSDSVTIAGALKIARTMRDWTKKMIPGTISLKRLAEADADG